ncbi:DUF1800 domain-containing protein [Runella aurantiaca]|uniref:DUF1800 domain-containing protein n=2 Tax=Runella aurantiaca TaxID=2282308 RepID=A0A369I042_9BACT|nr:DUF1800 domain-containing protein [Runella aurantiaca]
MLINGFFYVVRNSLFMKFCLLFFCYCCFLVHLRAQSIITFGQGNTPNVSVTASSQSSAAIQTLTGTGFLPNSAAASRFLSQATLGHNFAHIQDVANLGVEKWLDNQLALPNSFRTQTYLAQIHQMMVDSLTFKYPSNTYTLSNVFVGNTHFDVSWFQGAMTAPDAVRWRVAWALSELFVVSRVSAFDDNPYALSSYYDLLLENGLGTYRNLLEKITYHPAMGVYLTFMNNHATDSTNKVYPDENYARELMQLFSIGLYKLNVDGTEMRDVNNNLIPTYNNNDIAGLAKVFTGLSWGDSRYLGDNEKNNWSYTLPMKFFPIDSSDAKKNPWKTTPRIVNGHEPGPKTFLGVTIPARPVLQGEQDIKDALDVLANHPNVGPFIARRLIQRLVMSNPSPSYIQRVATVFNNNGSGVRGDLKAVVRAVLLDAEARDCSIDQTVSTVGALREPFLRYMNLMRGLPLTTQGGVYRNVMVDLFSRLEQKPLNSPSVFNFFQPDFQPDGELKTQGKFAPEFQLVNSQTITAYVNALGKWLIDDDPVEYWGLFNGETYKTDQDSKFNLVADYAFTRNDKIVQLLDKYNLLFTGGKLSAKTLDLIRSMVIKMPYSENTNGVPNADQAYRRVRLMLVLILSSPDYLINR